ncbi:hypothetical protein AAVH_02912 [Aphelenchoides avenae]|nr:hypothetical protein AAVH_02912 [Aphelenchus avenae]
MMSVASTSHALPMAPLMPQPRPSASMQKHVPPRYSLFYGALDYQKKLDQLKTGKHEVMHAKKSSLESPVPNHRDGPVDASKVDIINHVSRDEFIDFTDDQLTPRRTPRISVTKPEANGRAPKQVQARSASHDDLSESSFVVVHNTLKVAWEKDMYHQRIEESDGRPLTKSTSSDESDVDSVVHLPNGKSSERRKKSQKMALWKSSDADEIDILP